MTMRVTLAFTAIALLGGINTPAWAGDRVFLEANFESGAIQPASTRETQDSFYIQTLPNPQINGEGISTGAGGFGPETNWDTRVVHSEIVGGHTVLPRAGDYFLRSAIYWDKDYNVLNGFNDDRPRSGMNFAGTGAGKAFQHDEEAWIGFSVFLPANWEHEHGVHDHRGSVMLLSLSDQTRAASAVALSVWTPPGSETSHWQIRIQINDSAVQGSSQSQEWVSLGSIQPDLGKWTDFVFRIRSNPFTKSTNPAKEGIQDSMDMLFEGNRGILQVWKSDGPQRAITEKISRVNTPIGYVPHATRPIEVSFRIYKYGWRRNPTTVKGPVWVGCDEMRYGTTERHGTGFDDVIPRGESQINRAPMSPKITID